MTHILHVIKTKSYQSDGRLLKWVKSLEKQELNSKVFILEDDNQEGIRNSGSSLIKSTSLYSRKFFKKGKGFIFKVPEFTFKACRAIWKSNEKYLIFHDNQVYLAILFVVLFKRKLNKTIIWDLHELPHEIFRKFALTRLFIKYLLEGVDFVIYTNKKRKSHINDVYKNRSNDFEVLNNYPDKVFVERKPQLLKGDLKEWLKGSDYILWMGAAVDNRCFRPFFCSLVASNIADKLVVMGSIDSRIKEWMKKEYPDFPVFNKFVSQDEISMYVDNAKFSVVLYKNSSNNNWYCEPNRLYQLITRKIPIISGVNPPMKEIVERYNAGIVLDDDGTDELKLTQAIEQLAKGSVREVYKNSLSQYNFSELLSWEYQFVRVFNKIFDK